MSRWIGFPAALFPERTGLPLPVIDRPMRRGEELGLLERDHHWIRPTPRGRRFLNDLLELFLPGQSGARGAIPIVRAR